MRAFLCFRRRSNKIITSNTRATRITATEIPALAPENSLPGYASRVVEPEGAEVVNTVVVVVPLGQSVDVNKRVASPGEIVTGSPLRIETTLVSCKIDKGVVGIEEPVVNLGVLSCCSIRPRRFRGTAAVIPMMPKNEL
jgi:hypothetical protein